MPSRDTIRQSLASLLEEEMGEAYPMLADDLEIKEGLGLDSVDLVGLVMRVEREYRIRLSTEELAGINRVGDLLDLMEAKLAARDAEAAVADDAGEPPPGVDGQALRGAPGSSPRPG